MTSATEVVIFAMACMALNILVGYTGLVSFGHGAWFGLAAYIAALIQRELTPGSIVLPILAALAAVAFIAWTFGFLILRRRGVYFSLLTMALAAMMYVVAFRWTAVTGGENGLGGIVRPDVAGLRLETNTTYLRPGRGHRLPGRVSALALSSLARRPRPDRHPRE